MMILLNPLEHADSKNPIFIFFADFWVWVTSKAWVSLGRILGVPSIEPLLGGGTLARGLYRPPPLQLKARLPLPTASDHP